MMVTGALAFRTSRRSFGCEVSSTGRVLVAARLLAVGVVDAEHRLLPERARGPPPDRREGGGRREHGDERRRQLVRVGEHRTARHRHQRDPRGCECDPRLRAGRHLFALSLCFTPFRSPVRVPGMVHPHAGGIASASSIPSGSIPRDRARNGRETEWAGREGETRRIGGPEKRKGALLPPPGVTASTRWAQLAWLSSRGRGACVPGVFRGFKRSRKVLLTH